MKAPETISCSAIATKKLCITETSFVSKRNVNYLLLSAWAIPTKISSKTQYGPWAALSQNSLWVLV